MLYLKDKNINTEKDDNQQSEIDITDQLKGDNTVKNPDDWTTGDEPMTGAQSSYLKTLSDEAGEDFVENLSKAEASNALTSYSIKPEEDWTPRNNQSVRWAYPAYQLRQTHKPKKGIHSKTKGAR